MVSVRPVIIAHTSMANNWHSVVAHLVFFPGICWPQPQPQVLPFFGEEVFYGDLLAAGVGIESEVLKDGSWVKE